MLHLTLRASCGRRRRPDGGGALSLPSRPTVFSGDPFGSGDLARATDADGGPDGGSSRVTPAGGALWGLGDGAHLAAVVATTLRAVGGRGPNDAARTPRRARPFVLRVIWTKL